MSRLKKPSRWASVLILMVSVALMTAAGPSKADFPAKGDDNITSLGSFAVKVMPQWYPLLIGDPYFDEETGILESMLLYDPSTVIGRSDAHSQGSTPDVDGTLVGTANTLIKNGDMMYPSDWPEGTGPGREIHTEVYSLEMDNGVPPPNWVCVRAGIKSPDRPFSPGEVEADDRGGDPPDDFPAHSFFNVYCEVDFPLKGIPVTVYNEEPLMIFQNDLPWLPPRVVYQHGDQDAVPVYFKFDGPEGPPRVRAGNLFGHLILAGHGADYDFGDEEEYEGIYGEFDPMDPHLIPATGTLGFAVLAVLLLSFGVLFLLRRSRMADRT